MSQSNEYQLLEKLCLAKPMRLNAWEAEMIQKQIDQFNDPDILNKIATWEREYREANAGDDEA